MTRAQGGVHSGEIPGVDQLQLDPPLRAEALQPVTETPVDRAVRQQMVSEIGVGTVFFYQLIEWVADLADFAERVGNRTRLLIAR